MKNELVNKQLDEILSKLIYHYLTQHPDPDMTECKYAEDVRDEILALIASEKVKELEQLYKHEAEADKMGCLLVIGKGYIMQRIKTIKGDQDVSK